MKRKPSDHHNEALMTLGTTLRMRREAAGLSRTELAKRLQVSLPHLSRLERDEVTHPSLKLLQRIAKCLDIRLEDLYALTGLLLPTDLPDFIPYLHAKHPDWPDLVVAELADFCDFLQHKYSLH